MFFFWGYTPLIQLITDNRALTWLHSLEPKGRIACWIMDLQEFSFTVQHRVGIRVPQGSCLGPLLFLLYINNLPFALSEVHATMYADGTTISYSSDNMEDLVAVVYSEISLLNRWLQGNKLSLNIVKARAMITGSKQRLSHMKINTLSFQDFILRQKVLIL